MNTVVNNDKHIRMEPDEALASLTDLMLDYAELQHQIAALVQRQAEAISTGQFTLLNALNDALEQTTRELVSMEPRRVALIRKVVEKYPLPEGPQTLSTLCRAVPSPWKERLEDARDQWLRAATAGKTATQQTRRLAEQALRHTRTLLVELAGRHAATPVEPGTPVSGNFNTVG